MIPRAGEQFIARILFLYGHQHSNVLVEVEAVSRDRIIARTVDTDEGFTTLVDAWRRACVAGDLESVEADYL